VHYAPKQLIEHCRTMQQAREDAGTADRPFEIIASPLAVPSRDLLDELEGVGVTMILTSAWIAAGENQPDGNRAEELLRSYADRFFI
jgi:hypothetical protein